MGRPLKGRLGKMTFKRGFGYLAMLSGLALAVMVLHSLIFSPATKSGEGMPLSVLLVPAFLIGTGYSWSREEDPEVEVRESWSEPLTYWPIFLGAVILGAAYLLVHALSADSLKVYCLAAGVGALAIGFWLDLSNLWYSVQRTIKDEGPSGIPIVPFAFYAVGVAIGDPWLQTGYRPLLWLFVFHLSISFVIPFAFDWFYFREERARAVHARKRLK